MKAFLNKYSTGKIVAIVFLITHLVYVVMLAVTIPKTSAYAGGMKLLDMMPGGYDLDYVRQLFTALGEKGRNSYLFIQLPVDMIYPGLFALCYALLMVFLLKKLQRQNGPLFYASWIPVIAGLADYCENLGIISLLMRFPQLSNASVKLTSLFSIVKSSSTTLYFVVLLAVILWLLVNWLKRKK